LNRNLLPAATLLLLRSNPFSVLMAKRHADLAFGPNHWVFPGGRIDPNDRTAAGAWPGIDEAAARYACLREAREETGIHLDAGKYVPELVPFARWIAPPRTPRRFDTWFFLGLAPEDVLPVADGTEIVEAEFVAPGTMLQRLAAGEAHLLPPTALTVEWLASAGSAGAALEAARIRDVPCIQPEVFLRDAVPWIRLPPESGYHRLEYPAPIHTPRPPAT
jgi:8-oxo-dGTP pyrophosphatase MutT (NUDIX family)